MNKNAYRGHRFPPAIIQVTVWMYARFTLSLRDVEELLAERGLDISYETVRRWFLKFGQVYARSMRHGRHRPTDRWYLDEMVIVMGRRRFYLWRAVDSEAEVLDFPGPASPEYQSGRTIDAQAPEEARFCAFDDKLGSYGAAKKNLGLHAVHEQGLRRNNRCENSHLPVRRREQKQQRFKSPGSAQRFLNIHAAVYNLFNIGRHLTSRRTMKEFRCQAFRQWRELTAAA